MSLSKSGHMMMKDGSSLPLETVMRAWRYVEGNDGLRFDRPFRLAPNGRLLEPCRDEWRLTSFYTSCRERGYDMFPFFRVMHKKPDSEQWILCSLTTHYAIASFISHFDKPDAARRATIMIKLGDTILVVQFACLRNGVRTITLEMIANSPPHPHVAEARIMFVDFVAFRRLGMKYLFPTVSVKPRDEPESCPICLETVPLDVEFSGCGHRLHDACLARLDPLVCCMCRTPFFVPGAEGPVG